MLPSDDGREIVVWRNAHCTLSEPLTAPADHEVLASPSPVRNGGSLLAAAERREGTPGGGTVSIRDAYACTEGGTRVRVARRASVVVELRDDADAAATPRRLRRDSPGRERERDRLLRPRARRRPPARRSRRPARGHVRVADAVRDARGAAIRAGGAGAAGDERDDDDDERRRRPRIAAAGAVPAAVRRRRRRYGGDERYRRDRRRRRRRRPPRRRRGRLSGAARGDVGARRRHYGAHVSDGAPKSERREVDAGGRRRRERRRTETRARVGSRERPRRGPTRNRPRHEIARVAGRPSGAPRRGRLQGQRQTATMLSAAHRDSVDRERRTPTLPPPLRGQRRPP